MRQLLVETRLFIATDAVIDTGHLDTGTLPLDYAGTGIYTLYYAPVDVTAPSATISGVASVVATTIDSLTIQFSEAIDPSTFTLDDLVLSALDEDPSERPYSARDLEQRLLAV